MNKETKRKKEEMDYTIEEKAMFMREALKEAEIASPMMKYRLAVSWSRMVRLSGVDIMRVRSCSGRSCMRNHGDRGGQSA